jgi:hypothetical protein
VISFTRSLSKLAGLRSTATRRMALALCTATALSLFAVTVPASAVVTTVPTGVGAEKVTVGLQPRSTTLHDGAEVGGEEPKQFANPTGAPVLPANKTYAIYWDPTDNYHGDWQGVIDTFFQNMGAGSGSLASVYAVDAQYTDAANQHADYASTFQGAYTDTDPYPAKTCEDPHPLEGLNYPWGETAEITCITSAQIETELKLFIADHKLPTGMGTIFYLLTPPGVAVCLDGGGVAGRCSGYHRFLYEKGEEPAKKAQKETEEKESYEKSFCSYHSDVNPGNAANGGPGTILYAAIPWIAGGLADYHIHDEVQEYDCQDGGFDPSSKPIEESEKAKEKSPAEILKEDEEIIKKEEVKKKLEEEGNKEAVKALEKAEKKEEEEKEKAEILAGPHQQEPNQVPCPSPDGYCDTGLADLIISQIGSEQQNIVTDPLLNGWQQQTPALRNEATDECRNFFAPTTGGSVTANPETFAGTLSNQTFGTGNYYLNDAFNLAALNLPYPGIPCLPGIRLEPKFTAPNPVNSGEVVGFDGMESDITLNEGTAYTGTTPKKTYAKYTWNFGDGTPEVTGFAPGAPTQNSPETSLCAAPWLTPCAASTFHSYQYGGVYNVTLTVIDTGGNKESVSREITVVGPPAPSSGGSSGGSTTTGTTTAAGAGSSGSSTPPATTTKPLFPGPVASAAVVSHSLTSVLKKGLLISYSVNEQVAGQFQVLLASSVAKRIGLHGPPATGMAPGSAPSIVIAKAILITTKGGRNTVKILFGKKTAAKLRKLRSVTLTIRLVVRNASSHTPLTTTVISTVTLSR